MGEFHQHPDGYIIVRSGAKFYVDSRDNFTADYGKIPPEVPENAVERIYSQGNRHCYTDGSNVVGGGDLVWPWGDQAIAALDSILAKQEARAEADLES